MQFLDFPTEIFLCLSEVLPLPSLNFLHQTNRRLYGLLNSRLYRCSADSALLWGAQHGYEETARKALIAGASVRAVDLSDQTPLLLAAQHGHVKVVELLIVQDGIDLNYKISDWSPQSPGLLPADDRVRQTMSPLVFAAECGHKDVVKLLLEQQGVNTNCTDFRGRSVLHHATREGSEPVLQLLLKHDRTRDAADGSLLLYAFDMKRYSAALLLLNTEGFELDMYRDEADEVFLRSLGYGLLGIVNRLLVLSSSRTESGHLYDWTSPLAWSVVYNDKEAVASLLANPEVDPNHQEALEFTPLSLAICMENEEMVRLLLATDRVDPNIPDKDGRSPLWIAASMGHTEMVMLLLAKKGIDVNSRNEHNETPLTIASEHGHVATVELLLAQDGVEPDIECDRGWTPLHVAVMFSHVKIVELLLKTNRVNPNCREGDEYTTPLLVTAVQNKDLDIVELLLANDVLDPNPKGIRGLNALSQAVAQGSVDIVDRLLLRDDVNVNCLDTVERTPLDVALQQLFGEERERILEVLRVKGAVRGEDLRLVQKDVLNRG